MADQPPPPPDQNILVYVPEYHQNGALQTSVNDQHHHHLSHHNHHTSQRKPTTHGVYYKSYERCDRVRSEGCESSCGGRLGLGDVDHQTTSSEHHFKQLHHPHPHPHPPEAIAPPYGWKRLLTNGFIIYVSASNTALSSMDQIKAYLQSEGTCKCGLECPVNCDTIFNFNPKVLTRPWTAPVIGPGDLTKLCNHKRKLLTHNSYDGVDSRYDAFRKKKKRIGAGQPPMQLSIVSQRERDQSSKDQLHQAYNGLPWRENINHEYSRESYSSANGYGGGSRFQEEMGSVHYQRTVPGEGGAGAEVRYSSHLHQTAVAAAAVSSNIPPPPPPLPPPPHHQQQQQINYEQRLAYGTNQYEAKYNKSSTRVDVIQTQETQQSVAALQPVPTNLNVNKTPPWQQKNQQTSSNSTFERVPPLHAQVPVWNADFKKKQTTTKIIRKRYPEESGALEGRCLTEPPSFMDDPSGYLAQQTALLNNTISRQNANSSPAVDGGVPLASNINKLTTRPKIKTFINSRFPDSSMERRKHEEPSSTLIDKNIDDRGPIQGSTVSTSDRGEGGNRGESMANVVTTMASGHTASCNTITSVVAGKANTATVTVNRPGVGGQMEVAKQHILLSSNGQLLVAANSGQAKVPTSSPPHHQLLNQSQPTVLNVVNTLPGPLLLQPSLVVDTVQIPQIMGQVLDTEGGPLLSPDSKRKTSTPVSGAGLGLKKRKLSPTTMLLSPTGSNSVMVQQQQIAAPMLQALTILPGKSGFGGPQQLITTSMLQPLNLVQNFPVQQFIVPAGVSGMVMSDGTILQDGAVQLNLLTPVQNANVFAPAQGMVLRTPTSQAGSNKVIPNGQFLSSPNQYLVNNTFGGQLSPILNVSPNQCSRSQEFLSPNVVVQQPSSSNTTVVQQNTTIVQQTTMVSNQQTQPTSTLNLNQNFILNEKPNFILTSEKQNFILSPNSNDKIIISPESMRGNFVLGNLEKPNFVIEKQNMIINNFDGGIGKGGGMVDKKSTVSTQTQAGTGRVYRESPPDTTTLSPVDPCTEVTTSLQPTSPVDQSLCVSSSSHHDDSSSHSFTLDNYMHTHGHLGKQVSYGEDTSCLSVQPVQIKDENYGSKMSLCEVPDSAAQIGDGETKFYVQEEF